MTGRSQEQPPGTIRGAQHHPLGTHAKETMPGRHARTRAPTASGQRTQADRPKGARPGEDKRLTLDAPHNGARQPPWGHPPATPTARNAGSRECTLWDRCWVTTPTPPAPGTHWQRSLPARPEDGRPGEGERLKSDAPHNGERSPPPGQPIASPRSAQHPSKGTQAKGTVRVPARAHPRPRHVGSGPQLPGPRKGGRGRTSALPRTPLTTARGTPPVKTSRHIHSAHHRLARAHALGLGTDPHAHTTRAQQAWATGPMTGGPERESTWHQTPLTKVRGPPPRGGLPPPVGRVTPRRARTPKGRCRVPTPNKNRRRGTATRLADGLRGGGGGRLTPGWCRVPAGAPLALGPS